MTKSLHASQLTTTSFHS